MPPPAHNRLESGQPQARSITEGACFLLTWCPESVCTCELLPGCLGCWPRPHLPPGRSFSSLITQPSPPLQSLSLAPHRHAGISLHLSFQGSSPPPPLGPAASRTRPSGLSPPLSPGPSHSPSPSAPSSSFQPEERFYLPSLTQRDFLVGLGGSWSGGGLWGSFTFPMRAVPTPSHLSREEWALTQDS